MNDRRSRLTGIPMRVLSGAGVIVLAMSFGVGGMSAASAQALAFAPTHAASSHIVQCSNRCRACLGVCG
jgi:hypothetical protein